MVHPNPYGKDIPRSPRDPLNEPDGGYSHESTGRRDGYGRDFRDGPVDSYGRYNPHGENSYLPGPSERNGLAIAALILGIIAMGSSVPFALGGVVAGIAGVICGSLSLNQVKQGLAPGGKTLPITALVLSGVGLVSSVATLAFIGWAIHYLP